MNRASAHSAIHSSPIFPCSLPCRDLANRSGSTQSWAVSFIDTPGFAEVMLVGLIVGLSEQSVGLAGRQYPHYG
jgi:hypothetical protein